MPSNKDLKNEATGLAKDYGVELNFKDLSNIDLAKLVSDLKAKIKDRDTVTQLDDQPVPAAKVEPPVPAAKVEPPVPAAKVEPPVPAAPKLAGVSVYKVAEGKAITCKKGVLGPGDEVKIEYIEGGQQSIDTLFKRKYLIKE